MSENEQKYGFHRHVRHAAVAVGYGTEADLTPAPTAPVERMAAAAEQLDYAVSALEAMVERLIEGDHVPVEHTNKEPRRAPYMSPMHALRNAPDEMSAAAARVQRLQERLLEAFISE